MVTLTALEFSSLHSKALDIVSRYRKCEYELIEILLHIESKKAYLNLGYSSLFQYVVQALKLGENIAYVMIGIARKSREIPALKEKIRTGEITISNARRIVPVLTQKNQTKWLSRAASLSHRKLEKKIVEVRPEAATPERARYTSRDRVKLELGMAENDILRLRRVQDLLSQRKKRSVSLEEVLNELTTDYLKRNDPLEKSKRHVVKVGTRDLATKENLDKTHPNVSERNHLAQGVLVTRPVRTLIPAALKHQVNFRDKRKCMYALQDGKKCGQMRWLDIHHIKPVSLGGTNTLDNLTTLCSAHHRYLHESESRTPIQLEKSRGS